MDRGAWLASLWGQKESNMTEQLLHFQELKMFWNDLNLFFENILIIV